MRDSCGRTIDYLRLSVTDLCNYRCQYCMPAEGVAKKQHSEICSVEELVEMFRDFYGTPSQAKAYIGFDADKANEMLARLNIAPNARLKTLSKGNKEKVQLVLAMSRNARLYLLDEPIGGVDPAARDYILNTIISSYSKDATVVISTHLIEDIEPVLDEAVFLKDGRIFAHRAVDDIRETEGKSVDAYFREVFKC